MEPIAQANPNSFESDIFDQSAFVSDSVLGTWFGRENNSTMIAVMKDCLRLVQNSLECEF
jgi:hypothetical protein